MILPLMYSYVITDMMNLCTGKLDITLPFLRLVRDLDYRRSPHPVSHSSPLLAVFFLDYVQTLPMEIEAVWSSRLTGASIVFLLNRYVFAASLILSILYQGPGSASDKRYIFSPISQH